MSNCLETQSTHHWWFGPPPDRSQISASASQVCTFETVLMRGVIPPPLHTVHLHASPAASGGGALECVAGLLGSWGSMCSPETVANCAEELV
jgi:hypothetical protein